MNTRTRSLFLGLAVLLSSTSLAQASSFTDALENTYSTNPTIKAERERQESTDEGVSQALAHYRPTIGLEYERGTQSTKLAGTTADGPYENKTLTLNEPIFRGGSTINDYQASKQRVLAGRAALNGTEQQVMQQAIEAYMDVVADSAILELARNNEGVLDKQLGASNERFKVGEVTRTDVSQSQARLSSAKSDVISAEGQLISSIAVFQKVIGYKPEGKLDVPDQFPEIPANLDEALTKARSASPQLLEAIHTAKSAKFDARKDIGDILPQVALIGTMERQDNVGYLGGDSNYQDDSIGVRVSIPLYQSGAEWSRVREAKAEARQRQHQAMDTQQLVEQRVTQAWEELETATATIKARQDQIKADETAVEGVKQEQEYGARTILDVLDAQQELFSARTGLVRAQRDRVVAAYNLAMNLGDLTPQNLGLKVAQYDSTEHYGDVKNQLIGY